MRRAAVLTLACAACSAAEPVDEASAPIVGGTPDSGDPAVVMLASYPADMTSFETCTASVIAPKVLLTAAHCLDPATHAGYTFGVFTGPDASAYTTAAQLAPQLTPIESAHVHPNYDKNPPFLADIGVVLLAAPLSVTPLPVNRAPLPAKLTGAPARIVGYGQTIYNQFNAQKHQATTVLASIGADDTIVVGDGTRRSCVGDSGGPALLTIDGVETIAGVDSYTDLKGCLEPANYRRPDLYTAFLDTYVPPPPPDAGGGGGGGGTGGGGGGGPKSGGDCAISGGGERGGLGLAAAALILVTARRRRWYTGRRA